MTKDMLGQVERKLVVAPKEALGCNYDLLEKLLGREGEEWLFNLKLFLRKSHSWEREVSLQHFGLHWKLPMVPIPSRAKNFLPRHYFKEDIGESAKVKIKRISNCFGENFISKKEKFKAQKFLLYFDLESREYSLLRVISRLGGEERVETTLWDLYFLMSGQSNGEEGPLLTNSFPNIFFIRDKDDVLWVISLNWYETGWSLGVKNIGYPFPCLARSRIFFNR